MVDCAISIIHEAFAGFLFMAFEIKKAFRFKFIKDIPCMKGIDIKRGLWLSVISMPKERKCFYSPMQNAIEMISFSPEKPNPHFMHNI